GALREDVEYQARAVDDVDAERFFQVALLHRRQRVVEDRERCAVLLDDTLDLLDLSGSGEMRGVGPVAATPDDGARADSCARRELAQLLETFGIAALAEVQTDEYGVLGARGTLNHRVGAGEGRKGEECSTGRR